MKDDTENLRDLTGNGRRRAEPIDGGSNSNADSVAESVVVAVSALTDTDPIELDPLHEVVNVDALENLFAPTVAGMPRQGGRVSFVYEGCDVTVHGNDRVLVEQHE